MCAVSFALNPDIRVSPCWYKRGLGPQEKKKIYIIDM